MNSVSKRLSILCKSLDTVVNIALTVCVGCVTTCPPHPPTLPLATSQKYGGMTTTVKLTIFYIKQIQNSTPEFISSSPVIGYTLHSAICSLYTNYLKIHLSNNHSNLSQIKKNRIHMRLGIRKVYWYQIWSMKRGRNYSLSQLSWLTCIVCHWQGEAGGLVTDICSQDPRYLTWIFQSIWPT